MNQAEIINENIGKLKDKFLSDSNLNYFFEKLDIDIIERNKFKKVLTKIPFNYAFDLVNNVSNFKERIQIKNILFNFDSGAFCEEISTVSEYSEDYNPVFGLTRMYKDRVLISPVQSCLMHCPWCFRDKKSGRLNRSEWETIFEYIKKNEEICDVILTGGEPLLLTNSEINEILKRLRSIQHVKIIRFHTRMLIISPSRFDKELLRILNKYNTLGNPIYFITQMVHPLELSDKVKNTVYSCVKTGIYIFNQFPVLKGINDDQETFNNLNHNCIKYHIKPYYAILPIVKNGLNSNYFVSEQKLEELNSNFASKYDGLAIPKIIIPVMGKKFTMKKLSSAIQSTGNHYRNTKSEI